MQPHNFDVDIVIPSSNQKVKINKDVIQVNQTIIPCADVTAVKYGVSLIGKRKKPTNKSYSIEVQGKDGKTVSIKFDSKKVGELLEEDHTYYYIMTGLWHFVKKQLVNFFITQLNEKQTLEVGTAKFNFEGFTMSYKTWFLGKTKTALVPWTAIKYHLDKGILHLQDVNDTNKKVALSLHYDWNAVVLNTLLHFLWQEKRREKLQKGEHIEP
ncbi:MAG: hypothetical protein EOP00_16520 [Pedobacter sp.]|nr:MAG: hypothetical protein EOP00_16520 [Pedobacter sp.]